MQPPLAMTFSDHRTPRRPWTVGAAVLLGAALVIASSQLAATGMSSPAASVPTAPRPAAALPTAPSDNNAATAAVRTPSPADVPVTVPPRPADTPHATDASTATDDALRQVAIASVAILAALLAAVVIYLRLVLPRVAPRTGAVGTAGCIVVLAAAAAATALWADAGVPGAVLATLLALVPAVALAVGHYGHAVGRGNSAAQGSRRAAARVRRGGVVAPNRAGMQRARQDVRLNDARGQAALAEAGPMHGADDASTSHAVTALHAGIDLCHRRPDQQLDLAPPTGRATSSASTGASPTAARAGKAAIAAAHAPGLIGDYRIERPLGAGGMGTVHLARHRHTGDAVALKLVRLTTATATDDQDAPQARRRFLAEAALASRLQHPDIVRVVASGEQQGQGYIAMEYVEADDLRAHARADKRLPLATVVELVARTADALAHAHRQGVIHRDVKPSNLLWRPDTGAVKVTDFGVAHMADGTRTNTGVLLGTPTHMAPEQLAGRKVDGRTDLYALGVTLYQLLTGQLPQRAESMARLMYEIANVPAPDVRRLRPDVPDALADVVARLLAKDPAQRPPDGTVLAAELRRIDLTAVASPADTPAIQARHTPPAPGATTAAATSQHPTDGLSTHGVGTVATGHNSQD